MGYYSEHELSNMGFKNLGRNVKISNRAAIYNREKIEIGDYSRIDDFCVLSGKISIGRFCHVTVFCNLAGGCKGLFMADFSTLAYGVQVFTQSDDYSGKTLVNSNIPKKFKNEILLSNTIEKHVIVGAGSIIMPGVCLAEGTSVGANSLVIDSTTPWGIYYGSPAKRIKDRSKDLLLLEKQFLLELKQGEDT